VLRLFLSFPAVTFLEYWKRKNASLAHHWDCMGYKEEEERPRPEFAAKAPFLEKNPITGIKEPHFPDNLRLKRVVVGVGLICFMVGLYFEKLPIYRNYT
jgi:anoctamin-7